MGTIKNQSAEAKPERFHIKAFPLRRLKSRLTTTREAEPHCVAADGKRLRGTRQFQEWHPGGAQFQNGHENAQITR